MLSVNQMSVYHTVLEAYNITRNKSSDQLHQKFMHEGKHLERGAAKNYLYVPENPQKRCTGFSYIGPKLYNMIPKNIKEAQTKTFWKIETANAIFWMYLGGTA